MNRIILRNVRLIYPNLYETESFQGSDTGKYSATFLIPATDKEVLKTIQKEIQNLCKYNQGFNMEELKKKERLCIVKGEDTNKPETYKGYYRLKASYVNPPTVIDRNKNPIPEENNCFYSGCYVNASIDLWAVDSAPNPKRISANLYAVQFVDDGEKIGGVPEVPAEVTDDFDTIEETHGGRPEGETFVREGTSKDFDPDEIPF